MVRFGGLGGQAGHSLAVVAGLGGRVQHQVWPHALQRGQHPRPIPDVELEVREPGTGFAEPGQVPARVSLRTEEVRAHVVVDPEDLESLRVEAGIPAISAAIVQDGKVAWTAGKGRVDVEANIAARADTPYVVGSISQILGSTLLLRKCLDQSYLELGDHITRWMPAYPEADTTVKDLLTHIAPD